MWERAGLGPVFAYEWRMTARRWQMYAARSALVALILCGLTVVWKEQTERLDISPVEKLAQLGEEFYLALISMELTFILFAAPAAAAGAVCVDKARGTLLHTLVTDLSDTEIVLGKLAARLMPVLGLVGCSIPIMFICTLMGGIDPDALAGAFLVILGVAVLGCTLAFTLSVWGSRVSEVLLATYLVWLLLLLAYPMAWALEQVHVIAAAPSELLYASPYWFALAPYYDPRLLNASDYLAYLGVCLALSAVLVLMAIGRLRAVTIRQAGRKEKGCLAPRGAKPASRSEATTLTYLRSMLRPTLDSNPVLWREWRRRRPSRWSRWIWGIYGALAFVFSVLAVVDSWRTSGAHLATIVIPLQVVAGLLLLCVSAPGPLTDERTHATLEVLLTTPISTGSILWAKWRAAYRTALLVSILPIMILCLINLGDHTHRLVWTSVKINQYPHWFLFYFWPTPVGTLLLLALILAYGAAFTSLGLALATRLARAGWAIVGSVAACVFMMIGWPILVQEVLNRSESGLYMGSPLIGTIVLIEGLRGDSSTHYNEIIFWAFWWVIIYLSAALVLYLALWTTFDRRMGRMTARPRRRSPSPQPAKTEAAPVH